MAQAKQNKTRWVPDTYIIIFFVVIFAALLTWTVPVGQFDTKEIKYMMGSTEKSRTVLIPESFKYKLDDAGVPMKDGIKLFEPYGEVGFLNYAFEGMVAGDKWGSAVGVMIFILIVGGAFGIVLRTHAIECGIKRMIKKSKGMDKLIIPILFVLFSLGGAVFGMGEEAIPFVLIVVPVVIALGYDSIVAVMITYCATQIGFATSWMNPFSVAIAQGISQIPVLSGAGFRMFMWAFFTVLGIVYTMWYGSRIRKTPELSPVRDSDKFFRDELRSSEDSDEEFRGGHALVILTVVVAVVWIIWGVTEKGYYIPEIATQFFIMGLVGGIIGVIFKLGDMKVNDMASSFRSGASDLLGAAMVVGMAKGIILVLGGDSPTNATVLNTVLHNMGLLISGLSPAFSAWIMYLFQSVFNFFVVSGSGQAALTMPLMAPLADIAGITRQVAVLAFQLGDGFTNLIVPTSGCLMACIGAAHIDWATWAKWQIKFQGVLFLCGSVFVIAGVMIGFN